MSHHATSPPAGWYPDPEVAGYQRYWDGHLWTDHRSPLAQAPGSGPGASAPGSSRPGIAVQPAYPRFPPRTQGHRLRTHRAS